MDTFVRSVEELRVFTEEELVEKALEALKVFISVFPHEKKLNLINLYLQDAEDRSSSMPFLHDNTLETFVPANLSSFIDLLIFL